MSQDDEVVLADVEVAGRLLTDSIARDSRFASCDLQDALDAARFTSHPYATPPKEWPPFVDVMNSRELPPVLIERYNAAGGQGTALCGIFPEIRRAWATVDDTLFLWRFDKWDGQCPEYSGEEQAICAVGLVKAKPGVFIEAIQHLIVLATPVELVLLGVCCSGSGMGGDPFMELTLQPLPQYTIPTDGVTMTCITHTDSGRIFLGGRDGHLYELIYSAGHGWQSRCRKVCHTGGLGNLLSRWVVPNSLKFGAVDAIVEVVVDEERNILYTRTQESKLQMFDLGKNGDGAPKKVAEESRVGEQRDARGRIGGNRAAARATKVNIVSIAPISSVESKWLHLVAITSDGRRIYLSTSTSTGSSMTGVSGSAGVGGQKPSVLRVVMTRPAPTVGVVGGGPTSTGGFGNSPLGGLGRTQTEGGLGRTQTEGGLVIKAEAAHCSSGVMVLSDASPATQSRLLVATRDLTSSAVSSAGSVSISGQGSGSRSMRAFREMVTILGVEGRALAIADVLPPPEQTAAVEFSVCEPGSASVSSLVHSDEMVRARRLWARGELATQHVLPRRRSVILSTMGVMELAFNRPVDLLQKLLESNTLRSVLEDFFQRYGASEAAAMCLLLAARLTSDDDNIVPGAIADRAAEAFEDPRLVGVPQMQERGSGTNGVSTAGGFNMGQVVQEAEPVFSGAHDGLCLATARLLRCVWELPVMDVRKDAGAEMNGDGGIISCRLPVEAMQALEDKIRSLEQFLRARRNQRRGHYARVMGVGDMSAYGERHTSLFGVDGFARGEIPSRSPLMITYETPQPRAARATLPGSTNKRQRLPHKELSPAELAVMEVRGMECIRRLLRRSGEALRLLQLLQQHHVGRLAQTLDQGQRQQLAQLTFHQLVCSGDGEQIATRLVAALMEYYVAPDGRGTVDDVSRKLRDGCPSYYNESDYQFYQAVESLERAASSTNAEERDMLAKEALELLSRVPETADLLSVCQRFEDIRFYEAVVELPLRKARAVDPSEDAFNESIEEGRRQSAISARRQCYDVVTNALRSLKGQSTTDVGNTKVSFGASGPGARLLLDEAARESYIRQIVQLGVRWPDNAFHECLYQTMIELGLTQELLDLGGPDLVTFLQNAGSYQSTKASQVSSGTFKSPMPSTTLNSSRMRQPISGEQAKYLELLSRLYVHRRQHAQAAHVLLRLAERRQPEGASEITLEQRYDYLSNAVLQARSGSRAPGGLGLSSELSDSGLMELLEGKLAVLRFQQKIKDALDRIASGGSAEEGGSMPMEEDGFPFQRAFTGAFADESRAQAAREKSEELGSELKSITQLYNDYACRFELWEVCLEILHFSNYSGDAENSVMRETWTRLLDQALAVGGVGEACSVLRRVGPLLYPGDGGSMPLHTICLHLETAAHDKMRAGTEVVGDEDIPRALLAACKGAAEPVQRSYDRVLASGAILPKPSLRLRILRSVLTVMREWANTVLSTRMGSGGSGGFLLFGGAEVGLSNQGMRDKLATTANRYTTEVRRIALPPGDVEPVLHGFRELEEILQG